MSRIERRKRTKTLYLGEWLRRLDIRPAELSRVTDIPPPYLSRLISHKKANPGIHLLLRISEHLGVTVNDLYSLPPPGKAPQLSPGQIAALGELLDQIKRK